MPCTNMKAHVLKLRRILRSVAGTHLLNRERVRCQRFGAAARREEEEYPSWIFDRRVTPRQRQRSATLRATPWRAAGFVAPQSQNAAAMLLRRALPATRQGVAHPFPIYEMGFLGVHLQTRSVAHQQFGRIQFPPADQARVSWRTTRAHPSFAQ